MTVRYTRQFHYRDKGSDVEGVGRALARAHALSWNKWLVTPPRFKRTWGIKKEKALKEFKRKHGLKADYEYTKQAHEKLSKFFDAKAKKLMEEWHPPLTTADKHWVRLMDAMQDVSAHTPGYNFGGEHDATIADDSAHSAFDCSSSVSYVLWKAGLLDGNRSLVSGTFAREYGKPGRGEYFTVYANDGHVWIRLHKSRFWRFDTSPYGWFKDGDNRSGARLRNWPRPTWGFTARHWPGM